MVKSVLGVNHQGLRDWMIQRVSAVILAVYSLGLLGFILWHQPLNFEQWYGLFSHHWMKVSTLLFATAILWHAWIGIWTVFTDYIKCAALRAVLNTLVILSLIALFFYMLLILWSMA